MTTNDSHPSGPRSTLAYRGRTPVALRFGTSGLRGLVREMTDLEVYVNCRGFLAFARELGEVAPGAVVALAEDLRSIDPSSGLESSPRIARAAARAIRDEQLVPLHCGRIPTPALAYFATAGGAAPEHPSMPAIMVTGSHIPPDRNGVKFYRSRGEVLKADEEPILRHVARARAREYERPAEASPFDDDGAFREPLHACAVDQTAYDRYVQRYAAPWKGSRPLGGKRVVVLQHSAVGRDLLVELLEALGAKAIAVGRTDEFVAIDTENLDEQARERLRALAREHEPDAIVSTDGDSDRPLLADERGEFWSGDLVGVLTAQLLRARFAAVPVSTTDALERSLEAGGDHFDANALAIERTRIGSPYVIAAMQAALDAGHERVVGWEANGGFLTASPVPWGEGQLAPLPTRDAMLPLLCCLVESALQGLPLSKLFERLPARHSCAGLRDGVPSEATAQALAALRPAGGDVVELRFAAGPIDHESPQVIVRRVGVEGPAPLAEPAAVAEARALRERVAQLFDATPGLDEVVWLNFVDGLRVGFSSGDVAHLRPSGNAPQCRIYALSDSAERAASIVRSGLAEPDGAIARLVPGRSE